MRLSISLISKAFAPDSIFGRDRPRFNADAAAAPLRQMLPVCCRTERVTRIDLSTSEIEFDDGSGTLLGCRHPAWPSPRAYIVHNEWDFALHGLVRV